MSELDVKVKEMIASGDLKESNTPSEWWANRKAAEHKMLLGLPSRKARRRAPSEKAVEAKINRRYGGMCNLKWVSGEKHHSRPSKSSEAHKIKKRKVATSDPVTPLPSNPVDASNTEAFVWVVQQAVKTALGSRSSQTGSGSCRLQIAWLSTWKADHLLGSYPIQFSGMKITQTISRAGVRRVTIPTAWAFRAMFQVAMDGALEYVVDGGAARIVVDFRKKPLTLTFATKVLREKFNSVSASSPAQKEGTCEADGCKGAGTLLLYLQGDKYLCEDCDSVEEILADTHGEDDFVTRENIFENMFISFQWISLNRGDTAAVDVPKSVASGART
jgi:hypothetical protein